MPALEWMSVHVSRPFPELTRARTPPVGEQQFESVVALELRRSRSTERARQIIIVGCGLSDDSSIF